MTLPVADSTLIFQKVADGAVLFSPATETYFGLNEVGARVWELLPPVSRSLEEVCERLSSFYSDVPPATIRQDVEDLLKSLMAEGLLRPVPASPVGDVNGE